jgi:hypothetical protein
MLVHFGSESSQSFLHCKVLASECNRRNYNSLMQILDESPPKIQLTRHFTKCDTQGYHNPGVLSPFLLQVMKSSNYQTWFWNQNPIEEEEEMYIMTSWYMEAKRRKKERKKERK